MDPINMTHQQDERLILIDREIDSPQLTHNGHSSLVILPYLVHVIGPYHLCQEVFRKHNRQSNNCAVLLVCQFHCRIDSTINTAQLFD